MKVMCDYAHCGPHYVRTGWGRALKSAGHDFRFWDRRAKSAFDAFSEFEPDLYIGTTYDADRAVRKCVAARPSLRVALFASAWGPLVDGLDREKYPVVVATKQEKADMARLKDETGKPDFVFIHVGDEYLGPTMGGWNSIGIEAVGVLNAADVFAYAGARRRPECESDWIFVGGWWPYKARNLRPYILPLCHPDSGLNGKLFGNQPWPVASYLGVVGESDSADFFASAKVCLNVSEPHSTDLGFDLIERIWKTQVAGGFLVSDYVKEAEYVFGADCFPMAKTPTEFHDMVRYYVAHQDETVPYRIKGRAMVLAGHTYHHRVSKLLRQLGMNEEADGVLDALASFLGNIERP